MRDIDIFIAQTNSSSTSSQPVRMNTDGEALVSSAVVARTTNPTAASDLDLVKPTADDLGRLVVTPYQVRDLIRSASTTLTRGTETIIVPAAASTFHDIVNITGANTSGNAISVDIRFGTAGDIVESLTIAASSVINLRYQVPIPMSEVAQEITAQTRGVTDQSDSPITITIIAVKNI